jgi:integral membrane sensor domain MASE1
MAAENLALALFYFCLAWVSFSFARSSDTIAAIWPPSGVLLGVLLQSRRDQWPAYAGVALLASLAAGIAHIDSWQVSLGLAVASVTEAVVAAYVLRRLVPGNFRLTGLWQLVALFGIGSLAVACTGAVISGLVFSPRAMISGRPGPTGGLRSAPAFSSSVPCC